MYRALIHYWRVHLAVCIGAAVATAVVSGALLVGDSVRGSLRQLALERLGGIDAAVSGERFFRESLAEDLASRETGLGVAPAILLRGAAIHAENGRRASRIAVQGIDERFERIYGAAELLPQREAGTLFSPATVNAALAAELGIEIGDALLLSFERSSDVPRDTLMGEKDPEDVLGSLRVSVTRIVPDDGAGRFGLQRSQQTPLNVFVGLKDLQRSLGQRREVNSLLLARVPAVPAAEALLAQALRLEDLGLELEPQPDHLALSSREFVLRPDLVETVDRVATELGGEVVKIQSYLANRMRVEDRSVPYSMVTAVDSRPGWSWAQLQLSDGATPPPLGEGEILLNEWTARELGAATGEQVEMEYFVVGAREELVEERALFRVAGVVAMTGLAGDRTLTPDYPGIQEADDMAGWDPPFPVELERIRPTDEAYWDRFGATPKAFVAESTGRRLWNTRFGSTTSIRIGAMPGARPIPQSELESALLEAISPEAFGFRLRPVKQDALEAAQGATDFSGLFIAFSFFLIVSSALLVGLLFTLGVEQRVREIGLLLAVGYPLNRIRRRFLLEGGLLAGTGGLVGLVGGVGYAWLLMAGLRSLWLPAVGSSRLFLHVEPLSLGLGWLIALLVILLAVATALRRLKRIPPSALLAGSTHPVGRVKSGRVAWTLGWVCALLALTLMALAAATDRLASPALAFGSGSLLLISGLGFFAAWCRRALRRGNLTRGGPALIGMAARNSSWNPGRSMLSVALVASAAFVIVTVGASRRELGEELELRSSGSGGFNLVAQADIPLQQRLDREEDRLALGFEAAGAQFDAVEVIAMRALPGDDASCLNLYRPTRPRILGVPPELIQRAGFSFAKQLDLPQEAASPWDLLDRPIEPGVIPAIGDANSVQWILHLGLGQELIIEDEAGRSLKLRLVALLSGSIFQSELLISERALLEHFPSAGGYTDFLIETSREEERALTESVERTLEPFGFDVRTTRDKLAGYLTVEHTYLSTFQLLGGLGLLLGTVGLAVVLIRNVIERRGELATMRAFGFRRASLAWIVLAESAFLLLVGIGLGTAAALTATAPRLATTHVPWGSLGGTLIMVLVVGMSSSVLAALRALQVPLLPALKDER